MADACVVVVGSGPAGLGAALALQARGCRRVVVLERDAEAGGVPRHCGHPPYGLREFGRIMTGPTYARHLVARARTAGIEIRPRTTVTRLGPAGTLDTVSPNGVERWQAERVVLATGVRETPRAARLTGGDRPLTGVMNTGALQAYVYLEGLIPFRRPLIVGSELVSMSALLTCRKAGICPVAMIEPQPRPTTRSAFALLPRWLGVPLRLSTQLVEIRGDERVTGAVIADATGRHERVDCDGVLFTGGFVPAAELVRASHLDLDPGTGGPIIDAFGRCSDAHYAAAGNLLRPVENAAWCQREGQRIGAFVADDLKGRLPPRNTAVAVNVDDPIRFALPQRCFPGDARGLERWQLRLKARASGALRVQADDVVVAQRRVRALPERRLLMAMPSIGVGTQTVRIALAPKS